MKIEKTVPTEDKLIETLEVLPTEDIVAIFKKKDVPHSEIFTLYTIYYVFDYGRYLKTKQLLSEVLKGTEITQNIDTRGYMRLIITVLLKHLKEQEKQSERGL